MARVTVLQKIGPFLRYCLVITPFILLIVVLMSTVSYGDVFLSANKTSMANPLNNLRLASSTKYAASSMDGLKNNDNAKVISGKDFPSLVSAAKNHSRKRKMTDLTKNPADNSMQTLINTWIDGSYSPVHMHEMYSESFVVLDGALAFFTFNADGTAAKCNVLHGLTREAERLIIVEKQQYHAMAAAPVSLGWPGHAIVFETSGHKYDTTVPTKTLSTFAPVFGDGLDGDPLYFEAILKLCPVYQPQF